MTMISGLTKRTLRSIRDRWQRDYDQLERVYGPWDAAADGSYTETMRNLATAITQIGMMIAADALPTIKEPTDGK
jgi:hypothetical protein